MHEKTEFCIQTFNLPQNEQLVQNYSCTAGKLWITFNFFCYSSKLFKPVKISFRAVKDIHLSGKKIEIVYEIAKDTNEEIYFSLSFHAFEAYNIMQYLRYNSVCFVPLDDARSSGAHVGGGGLGELGQALSGREAPGISWGGLTSVAPTVDVQASQEAVRHMIASREMGLSTLDELRQQRETLDRMEHTTANIHANLDKSQRVVRGLSSFGGGLRNLLSRDKTRSNNPAFHYLERDIHLAERAPEVVELAILLKNDDDSFTPCVIRFLPKNFEVFNPSERESVKGHCWSYAQIEMVVLRARPLHIDVRFGGEVPRFRMMTSYAQAITNELFLRALNIGHEPEIVFEPNIPQFDYGSYRLSLIGSDAKYDPSNPFTAGGAQAVIKSRASDILHGVDEETRRAFDQQDRDVDAVIDIAGQLKTISHAIGREVEDSTRQIERVGTSMATATERTRQQQSSVEYMRH